MDNNTNEPIEFPDVTPRKKTDAVDNNDTGTPTGNSFTPPEENTTMGEDERAVISGESTVVPDHTQKGGGPLEAEVIERTYTKKTYVGDTSSPISEPVDVGEVINTNATNKPIFDIPNKTEVKQEFQQAHQEAKNFATQNLGERESGKAPDNPAVTTMSTKERKENLSSTVETFLDYYSKAKEWAGSLLMVSNGKLVKRENKGKAPADWAVLYDSSTNEILTIRQFCIEANALIVKACETDEEFKNKVRPLLAAEFDKRGWILSTQQNGLLMFGADLFMTGQKLLTIYMSMEAMLKKSDIEYEDAKKNGFISGREQYNNNLNRNRHNNAAPSTHAQEPTDFTNHQPADEQSSNLAPNNTEIIEIPKEEPEPEVPFTPPVEE